MSAVAPASSPRNSTGRLAAVCISAISSGEVVRIAISQVPAVSCIQVPRLETVEAIQRSRNSGIRRGSKPVGGRGGVALSVCAGSVTVSMMRPYRANIQTRIVEPMVLRGLMLLVVLWGGTVVWAQDAPPQPSTAEIDSKPLPPIPELLKVVEQHEKRDEALLLQYTYHVHHVMEEFDGDEAVKKTTVTDWESFTVRGVRIQRMVARNGVPLTPDEAKKENKRVD